MAQYQHLLLYKLTYDILLRTMTAVNSTYAVIPLAFWQ